jgi:hypothetical protein
MWHFVYLAKEQKSAAANSRKEAHSTFERYRFFQRLTADYQGMRSARPTKSRKPRQRRRQSVISSNAWRRLFSRSLSASWPTGISREQRALSPESFSVGVFPVIAQIVFFIAYSDARDPDRVAHSVGWTLLSAWAFSRSIWIC